MQPMTREMTAIVLRRFEQPDEVREMQLGRFELVRLGGMTIGRATYLPPEPHDSWVLGDQPYVSLHFLGADHYAR